MADNKKSNGARRLRSREWFDAPGDPTAHPRIFPEYFSKPEDLRALARSVRRMGEMMREQPIRDLIEAELTPGAIPNEQTTIEEDIRARAGTYSDTDAGTHSDANSDTHAHCTHDVPTAAIRVYPGCEHIVAAES